MFLLSIDKELVQSLIITTVLILKKRDLECDILLKEE